MHTLCTAEFGPAQFIVRSIVLHMCKTYSCKFVCLFVHMSECLFVGMHVCINVCSFVSGCVFEVTASNHYRPLCLAVCVQNILKMFKTKFSDYIIQDYGFRGVGTYFYISRTCLYMYSYDNVILLDLDDNEKMSMFKDLSKEA